MPALVAGIHAHPRRHRIELKVNKFGTASVWPGVDGRNKIGRDAYPSTSASVARVEASATPSTRTVRQRLWKAATTVSVASS